jgi:hypothetical protein
LDAVPPKLNVRAHALNEHPRAFPSSCHAPDFFLPGDGLDLARRAMVNPLDAFRIQALFAMEQIPAEAANKTPLAAWWISHANLWFRFSQSVGPTHS